MEKLGVCRGSKLKWWIAIKKKCAKAYGADSKWDRNRLEGKCSEAWSSCNTGFYAVCCTQPEGPKNMKAYCELADMTAAPAAPANADMAQGGAGNGPEAPSQGGSAAPPAEDQACEVRGSVEEVSHIMEGIKDTVELMDTIEEEPVEAPQVVVKVEPPIVFSAPAPAPMPGPAAMVPSGISQAAPAPAETRVVMGPAEYKPTKVETNCEKLGHLCEQALSKIKDIKTRAKDKGIKDDDDDDDNGAHRHPTGPQELEKEIDKEVERVNPEDAEAKDPDLVFSLKGVMKMGKKLEHLLKLGAFCNKGPAPEDDDDDSIEEDLNKNPEKDWVSDEQEDDEDEEEEEDPTITRVNETAVYDLMNWESELKAAVSDFETNVHPHGYKWWRYRYEYTVIESFVLAFSVMVLYLTMWLLHGVSFSQIHKFYKTGLPQRFYRYAWVYLVFHAASLMVMVTVAYMLYVPWGEQNIFNMFAEAFHDYVNGHANVPYLGYSWLYMVLDVQFQLFVCFSLYSLFITMVVTNYMQALREWKSLSEEQDIPAMSNTNVAFYRHMEAIMKKRIRNTPAYKQIFKDLKLRCSGVEGLDVTLPGWHDFRLHLYLTDGLGKSAEYLCEVSLTTNTFLAVSALVVASLAHHYQVAFMYFLPFFVAIGFVMFVLGYFLSYYFRKLSENDDHKAHSKYMTVHVYCRSLQIMLYCLFYSFSRLLLSNDIFSFYPSTYLAALVGLVLTLVLLYFVAGQVIKETTCALILPPHIPEHTFRKHLEQIVNWHTTEKCHECGAEQFPSHASLSKEWAGKKPIGGRETLPPESERLYSWRG
jgi:hypothetical protein